LEPNGRLHVIIELDGTHSEGKKILMMFKYWSKVLAVASYDVWTL